MQTVQLSPGDNIAVANAAIAAGAVLSEHGGLRAASAVPAMHKIAVEPIGRGEAVRKYGQVIGAASTDIAPGEHVHTHNCVTVESRQAHEFCADATPTDFVAADRIATFQGYRRADGRAATRNYVAVLTTVNCSATVAQNIAAAAERALAGGDYPNIDGVAAFVHTTGCGMSGDGEGYESFQRVLNGYARHPNIGAVLLVGLGCEVVQAANVLRDSGLAESDRLHTFNIQDSGGTRSSIERGVKIIEEMLPAVNNCRREPIPAGELILGLQCGGSDALSGVTANPALGAAVDLLVRHGGTGVLSETPEIYGAEHLLTRRAANPAVAQKLMERLRWWEDYARKNDGALNNNPSPGNKQGGLTTILEKSLGAQAKGGHTNLNAVYKYAGPITNKGLVFMDSPGYDPVSVTGQIAGGANIVCFTTGRGSAFGCKPAPSIKLATNTALFERMREDMDINCGGIVDGEYSVAECGERIFDTILRVASGEKTASEELGYGDNEFNPWQIGATY